MKTKFNLVKTVSYFIVPAETEREANEIASMGTAFFWKSTTGCVADPIECETWEDAKSIFKAAQEY